MENTLRPLFVATALAVAAAVSAQGGIRLIVWSYEPFFAGSQGELTHVGVGYDHDLNDRLSLGVQARYVVTGEGWVVNYRSAFHFAGTKNSSLYLGPMVG